MNAQTPSSPERFQTALAAQQHLTLAALDELRQGKIPEAVMFRVRAKAAERKSFAILFIVLSAMMFLLGVTGREKMAPVLYVLAAIIAIPAVVSLIGSRRNGADLRNPVSVRFEGPLKKTLLTRQGSSAAYFLDIGGASVMVDKGIFDHVAEGHPHRLFLASASRAFLAVEPL